jgi:hypothetical protein
MTTPTPSTLAILIEVAAERHTWPQLSIMLDRAGLNQFVAGGSSKLERVRLALHRACTDAEEGDAQAHRALLNFVNRVVTVNVPDPDEAPPWFGELREALLADGYDLTWEPMTGTVGNSGSPNVTYKIHLTDAPPTPLRPEASALEAELVSRGYTTVLQYYRDAVDNLINHKYTSANGDLRTTFEDLVTRLAEDHGQFERPPRANTGAEAIKHIVEGGHLPKRDGGTMLQGLWQMIQTNGPHPGQTDADEARWRMQMITATARFLLKHFSTRT